MKRTLVIVISLLGIGWSIYQLMSTLREEPVQQAVTENGSPLTVWVTSKGLVPVIREFSQEADVRVSIKTFREEEAMMDELQLAAQTSRLPDVVEVNTLWTLHEVSELVELETVAPIRAENLHSSIIQAFTRDGSYYAVPLGLEMPVQFINERLTTGNQRPEWELHMDRELPLYLRTDSAMSIDEFVTTYEAEWQRMIEAREMPALDHQMAITRFANSEVGKLIASSDQTEIVQQVVGNAFPYRVEPLRTKGQQIVVAGHGLAQMTAHSRTNDLMEHMQRTENLVSILSKTGWLPVSTDYLLDDDFLQQLPLPHIIRSLAANQRFFTSQPFAAYTHYEWSEHYRLIHEWERRYSQ